MFGLGFWEIAVVVLLAVTLFPPTEIPKLARSIARAYGTVRRTAEDFRSQIMDDEDLRAPLDEVRSAYNDARWQVTKVQQEARDHLRAAEREARQAVSSTTKATTAPALAQGDGDDHDHAHGHDHGQDHDHDHDHDHDDEHDHDHEPMSESLPAHAPVGYGGTALEDDEPDPRLAAFDEDDDEQDDDESEPDPFAAPEPKAPRSPIPGPPRGDGSSRAV